MTVLSRILRLLVLLSCCVLWSAAGAAGSVGVVLLHGKGGTPDNVKGLGEALSAAGYRVVAPEMPWSKFRLYNLPLAQAQEEIDRACEHLRRQGARRLVIIGHSMGGNMALAYGAVRPGLAGIVALAPGHTVERAETRSLFADSVARAREQVREGKGREPDEYDDISQGKVVPVVTSAEAYLSYFDPEGQANMPAAARKLTAPLLWVAGSRDAMVMNLGPDYAFALAPNRGLNRYAVVDADHMGTPDAAKEVVLAWLKRVLAKR